MKDEWAESCLSSAHASMAEFDPIATLAHSCKQTFKTDYKQCEFLGVSLMD